MSVDTQLTDLQTAAGDALRADEVLAALTIVDEEKEDILSAVETALATVTPVNGKCGACVILLAPTGDDENPETPGGPLTVKLTAMVLVYPLYNNDAAVGTGLKALTICRRIHRVWKHFMEGRAFAPLHPLRPCIVPVESVLAPVAYEVRFQTTEADNGATARVTAPTITNNAGALTLACNTSGAGIYYTTDGSFPRAGNPAAVLYTAPFTPAAASLVRAAAYKSNYLGSSLTRLQL